MITNWIPKIHMTNPSHIDQKRQQSSNIRGKSWTWGRSLEMFNTVHLFNRTASRAKTKDPSNTQHILQWWALITTSTEILNVNKVPVLQGPMVAGYIYMGVSHSWGYLQSSSNFWDFPEQKPSMLGSPMTSWNPPSSTTCSSSRIRSLNGPQSCVATQG